MMRLTTTRVTKEVPSPIMTGGVEPIPQIIMAMIAAPALRHMETSVPVALARFHSRPANTGTKMEPESSV